MRALLAGNGWPATYENRGRGSQGDHYLDTNTGVVYEKLADRHWHEDGPLLTAASLAAWPVGSVFLSVLPASPALALGGGVWTQSDHGRMTLGHIPGTPPTPGTTFVDVYVWTRTA